MRHRLFSLNFDRGGVFHNVGSDLFLQDTFFVTDELKVFFATDIIHTTVEIDAIQLIGRSMQKGESNIQFRQT